MDCKDIKIGDLMACETSGLHRTKMGPYIFGHVTQIELNGISNKLNYYVMWDNGNEFWYNHEEIEHYRKLIKHLRKN